MSVSHQRAEVGPESGHRHPHVEALPPPSEAGSVVLDIGGDIGALSVMTPEDMVGVELEIRASGTQWRGVHVAVLPRLLPSGTVHAALFPSLPAGEYDVRRRDEPDAAAGLVATIKGGQVTTVTWLGA